MLGVRNDYGSRMFLSRIYGIALIYLALDAFILGILPKEFLPFAVIIVGAMILFTPVSSSGTIRPSFFRQLRRLVLGIAVVFMGVISQFEIFASVATIFPYFTLSSLIGQIILFLIGLIFLLATTRTGTTPIRFA